MTKRPKIEVRKYSECWIEMKGKVGWDRFVSFQSANTLKTWRRIYPNFKFRAVRKTIIERTEVLK